MGAIQSTGIDVLARPSHWVPVCCKGCPSSVNSPLVASLMIFMTGKSVSTGLRTICIAT